MTTEKYTEKNRMSEVKIQENEIVGFNKYDKVQRSFRVYEGGYAGIHYQQGEMGDEEGYGKAKRNLDLKRPYPFGLQGGTRTRDKTGRILTDKALMEKAREELSWLRRTYPDFSFGGSLYTTVVEMAQENSAGMRYESRDGHNGIGIRFKHKDSKDIVDGYFSINMRQFSSAKFRRMADNYLAGYTKQLELPEECIIMMPVWELTGKLKEFLDAEKIALGISQLKVGQKAFSDALTVTHDVSQAHCWMSTFWDAEGFVPKNDRKIFIHKGKVLRGYADRRIAQKYGVECTGSAYQNFQDIPDNGWMCMRVQTTGRTPKEMLGGRLAIVPLQASGGGYKENCEYAMPVQSSYLTDGEKILGRLPPFTMRSTLFDIFGKDFIGVAKYTPLWDAEMLLVRMEAGKL